MYFCPHCGADRRKLAPIEACPSCGERLARLDDIRPATAAEAANVVLEDATKGRFSLKAAIGVAAAVALAAAIAVLALMALGGRASSRPSMAASATSPRSPEPPPPPRPAMPRWIAVRIERVHVRTDAIEWDGPVVESGLKDACKGLSTLVGLAKPEVGMVARLGCGLLGETQRQTDPREPDLQVLLDTAGATYTTHVAFDRRGELFGYPFVVPGSLIPAEGIVLSVVDADTGTKRGQQIGSLRLTREELIAATETGGLISRATGAVELIELSVRAHDGGLRKVERSLAATQGGLELRDIPVNAGDVVRIEAYGTWQIGRWNDDHLGPDGYVDGRLKGSNLALFSSDPHGAAVAVVGQLGSAVLLRPRSCVRVVSPYAGTIWVGVNDRSPKDNKGEMRVRVFARAARENEWRSPGALLGCEP